MAPGPRLCRALIIIVLLGVLVTPNPRSSSPVEAGGEPRFTLGFAVLRDLVNESQGTERVGAALEEAHHDAAGNAVQRTSGGKMVWRKADNWTAFTDGSSTWINSPYGLLSRRTTERFRWETATDAGDEPLHRQDLTIAFRRAIEDAEKAEPSEISRDLVAIVESNDQLLWKDDAGRKKVGVVTWTSWPGYNDKVGQSVAAGVDTWVTVAPEARDFCRASSLADKTLRLEQLLGLPPENGKLWFVEMWASPSDLFRPSPDPEITDHEAELDFRSSMFISTSGEYIAWFNDLRSKSYGENGYPWTRLGYTYDWGNPEGEVGLSEFVIRKGATVEILAVLGTADYCN